MQFDSRYTHQPLIPLFSFLIFPSEISLLSADIFIFEKRTFNLLTIDFFYRMEGSDNMDKVAWTKEMLHVFCDICIMTIELGMRPTMYFDKTR